MRVWQAADRILRSGRRPTIEGVRELIGGGSPNAVTAHIDEWYRDLGSRLADADAPATGFPPVAVALMTELWQIASAGMERTANAATTTEASSRASESERDAAKADATALASLNQELTRHRATAEKAVAESRALLSRHEAALQESRSRIAELEHELAAILLERELIKKNPKTRVVSRHSTPVAPRSSARVRVRTSARTRTRQSASARRKQGKESRSRNAPTSPGGRRPKSPRRK